MRDEDIEREADLTNARFDSFRNFSMRLYHDILFELIQKYNITFNSQQLKSFLRHKTIDNHIERFCEVKDLAPSQRSIRYCQEFLLFINELRKNFDLPIVTPKSLLDQILSFICEHGIHNLQDHLDQVVSLDFIHYTCDDNHFFVHKQKIHTLVVIFNMRQAIESGFFKRNLSMKTVIICDDTGAHLFDKDNTFNIIDAFFFNQRHDRLEQYSFDNFYEIFKSHIDIWLNNENNENMKIVMNKLKSHCLRQLFDQPIDWYLDSKNRGIVNFEEVIYEINHYYNYRALPKNKLNTLINLVILFKSRLDANVSLYSVLKEILNDIRQNSSLYAIKGKTKHENNLLSEENLTAILSLGLKSFFKNDRMINILTEEPSGNGRIDLSIKRGQSTVGIVESKLVKKADDFKNKISIGLDQLLSRYGNNYFLSYDAELHLYLIVFCHDKKFRKIEKAVFDSINEYTERNLYQYEVLTQGENEVTFLFKLATDPNSFFKKQQRYLTIFICNLEYFHIEKSAQNQKKSSYKP